MKDVIICLLILLSLVLLFYILLLKKKIKKNSNRNITASSNALSLEDVKKYGELQETIAAVGEVIINISSSGNELEASTNLIKKNIENVSAAIEEMSAGIQETSASAEEITASTSDIDDKILEISSEAAIAIEITGEMRSRAGEQKQNSIENSNKTKDVYHNVKESLVMALENSEAVKQIYSLSDSIIHIADQTKLLSMNAHIEAARAGEHGRGFSVVADEISRLSLQSSETAKVIKATTEEINKTVSELSESAAHLLNFVENEIIPDYNNFIEISDQYYNDVDSFNNSINNINSRVEALYNTSLNITNIMSDLAKTIYEEAAGVEEINKNMSEIMEESNLVSGYAHTNAGEIEKLAVNMMNYM